MLIDLIPGRADYPMTKPPFILTELKTNLGETILSISLDPKQFKTGSRGYYANKKLEIDGVRYQVQIQMVEIGSKNSTPTENG